ncbi:leucine-rich repeat domain-containing protein [Pseudomonas sp. COR58]|uniref:Leucine-rich repeat domain-containing protein n=1 Tax=Pseudomonas ekonensis TaxID=2842353 RepID=A0ABS6PCD6_9PSED|nr:leucine-rich repeat domain-containing protein [Pseudomonas ekonensis]MBV4458138.1 leucine-rich repeat domain-containing protein [Pseudomonas ekonensis]
MYSPSPSDPQSLPQRPVTRSLHAPLLEQSVPDWLMQATPQQFAALREADAPLPTWYGKATKQRRKAFDDSLAAHWRAQSQLGKAMAGLQDIHDFARPLLTKHLKDRFNVDLDVDKTFLRLTLPVETAIFSVEKGFFEASVRTLLQAALHNFEAAECEPDAFHRSSGFFVASGKGRRRVRTGLTVPQFVQACRTLDIGARYQEHLKRVLSPEHPAAQQALRRHFCAVQQTALRAAAERAWLQNDIGPEDLALILWLVHAGPRPALGDKKVWLFDLSLMRVRLTGCMVFVIGEAGEAMEEWLVFIPDDPWHPLKRYNARTMSGMLKQRFIEHAPADGSPSAYQAFFSRFVPYAERGHYFSQFRKDAPGTGPGNLWAAIGDFTDSSLRNLLFTHVPPAPAVAQVPDPDPFLALDIRHPKGPPSGSGEGGLWGYLFERHREQLIEDARGYAVPSADIDARVREERFARLFGIGMLTLNAVSMFVPVLGEVMMGAMACQLLEESIEGVVEWSEGDRRAAKAHVLDVAQNLVLAGALAGTGKVLSGLGRVAPEPLIEDLHPVTLPNGGRRLIRAGLAGYEAPVEVQGKPDVQGRYDVDGKSYVRIDGHVYEQFYDRAIERWRVRHPREPQAWSPVLIHNGAGAWRHELENPLTWDRRTLLRRMGPIGDAYPDEQLQRIADISGVSDNALRKMHMDERAPVAELADAMRLFDIDRDVAQVIDQVHLGHGIDERYLHTLDLLTRSPHWPAGRRLTVFADLERTGIAVTYGAKRAMAGAAPGRSIRVSRQNILDGELPWRILAELDESEITGLLGVEAAQERVWRPQRLRDRFAASLRTCRLELFDRLRRRTGSKDPAVKALRRSWPRLGDAAAQEVLEEADSDAVATFKAKGQAQDGMQASARWHSRRGRLTRALAGLHMDNMTTSDTRRLVLHALGRMPQWPDTVRLEIHDGQFGGRLIDSLGGESARLRSHVVKKGPAYEAVDGQGRLLAQPFDSYGDFFAAVAQALPAEVLNALGLPRVRPGVGLRRAVGNYVLGHLEDCAQALARRGAQGRWFKPAQRVGRYRVGYRASGEGAIGNAGMANGLAIRLRFLYPDMTFSRANGVLLERIRSGQSDAQILQWLEDLRGQWTALKQGLEHWIDRGEARALRRSQARALEDSWRSAPFAEENPAYARLDLQFDGALPELSTVFSHVVELRLRPVADADRSIRQFLLNFPMLERLDLSGVQMHRLDVSGMAHLRQLTLDGSRLLQAWPQGAENLESVSGIDLSNRPVGELPPRFFQRDDLLLNTNLSGAGLTAHGRRLLQDAHRRCELALGLPERTLERFFLEAVPDASAQPLENGTLLAGRLLPWPAPLPAVEGVPSFVARLRRIDAALSEDDAALWVQRLRDGASDEQIGQTLSQWEREFESLTRELNGWIFSRRTGDRLQRGRWTASAGRGDAARAMVECWKKGLADGGSWLDLSDCRGLGVLPRLPVGFAHVQVLHLREIGLNEADLQRFLPSFTGVRVLELGLNELRGLPSAIADMPGLTSLGLSGNRLDDFPALIHRLGAAHRLTALRLSYNRFPSADGDGLQAFQGLRELDLSHNHLRRFDARLPDSLRNLQLNGNDLRHWPDAVMAAPQLEALNLVGNPIREIPAGVFDGSHDRLLAGARIYGVARPLSIDSLLRIQAYMARTGASGALGISRERLEEWIADLEQASDVSSDDSLSLEE